MEKASLIETGDLRYFCENCEVLIEESNEDSVIRCPYCGKSIRQGVCVTWDAKAQAVRVQ